MQSGARQVQHAARAIFLRNGVGAFGIVTVQLINASFELACHGVLPCFSAQFLAGCFD
jgi:hypothetical protein